MFRDRRSRPPIRYHIYFTIQLCYAAQRRQSFILLKIGISFKTWQNTTGTMLVALKRSNIENSTFFALEFEQPSVQAAIEPIAVEQMRIRETNAQLTYDRTADNRCGNL